jgi:copper transport protein
MKVTLKSGLGSGKYTVTWATVSADDGDPANGTFVFTVALPAATSPAPRAATTPTLPRTGGLPPALPVAGGLALAGLGLAVRRIGR